MTAKSCTGCRFWSEMVAATSDVDGEVEALCLHESKAGLSFPERMVRRGCEQYAPGVAIDDPALRENEEL